MTCQDFTVESGCANLHCQRLGDGKPLLMIHGGACDSSFFLRSAEYLARNRQVIIYDRRGYGQSSKTDYVYTTRELFGREQASDAAAILSTLNDPADICACSMGTIIALYLLLDYPSLVDRIILHEPPLSEYTEPDHPIFKEVDKIQSVKNISFYKAYILFLNTQGPADDRACEIDDNEAENLEEEGMYFLNSEHKIVYQRGEHLPMIPDKSKIVVAAGEISRMEHTHCAECAEKFSAEHNFPLIPFPGGHNAAREIPAAFAASVEGVLNLDLQYAL